MNVDGSFFFLIAIENVWEIYLHKFGRVSRKNSRAERTREGENINNNSSVLSRARAPFFSGAEEENGENLMVYFLFLLSVIFFLFTNE